MISLPLVAWIKSYNKNAFVSDLIAGIITACIAVPQSMAYAQLAGFSAEYGLYSALLPLVCYALLGSSRTVVVGPAAIICLMVASTTSSFSPQSQQEYFQIAVNLTLLSAVFLVLFGVLRLGNLANLISKPVVTGFTSASALIIAVSQLSSILGLQFEKGQSIAESLVSLFNSYEEINFYAVVITAITLGILSLGQYLLPVFSGFLSNQLSINFSLSLAINKSAPVIAVIVGILIATQYNLDRQFNVPIVAYIPNNLPAVELTLFRPAIWQSLAMPALSIALLCFITSVSTGSTFASKRHERINPNQELIAVGVANLGGAVTGTFALAASLSRSAVNYSAGAVTQLSNVFSAVVILITVLFLSAYFYQLPQAVLGSIVVMSVLPMIIIKNIRQCWNFNKADFISLAVTFISTLLLGVNVGIWIGIACSLSLFIHRSSYPHIAEVGLSKNGAFKNRKRMSVKTLKHCVFLRIDENLYFANAHYIERFIMQRCSERAEIQHLVLIFSSVNTLDESALETLENLIVNLMQLGITLHLSDVKGILDDQLKHTNFYSNLSPGRVFTTTIEAMTYLQDNKIGNNHLN